MSCGNVFKGKATERKVQGIMTELGWRRFEVARRQLGAIYMSVVGRELARVSDGDVVEFLARGEDETRRYLRRS